VWGINSQRGQIVNLPLVEKYKGYTLRCSPQATHDEGFLAFVVITHEADSVRVDLATILDLPGFALKSEAALAALSAAIRWVDDAVPLPDTRAHPEKLAAETGVAEVDASHETPFTAGLLRAGQGSTDRRRQFFDRRQVNLADQPYPIDYQPALVERRNATILQSVAPTSRARTRGNEKRVATP
jgi:hypothetical protein